MNTVITFGDAGDVLERAGRVSSIRKAIYARAPVADLEMIHIAAVKVNEIVFDDRRALYGSPISDVPVEHAIGKESNMGSRFIHSAPLAFDIGVLKRFGLEQTAPCYKDQQKGLISHASKY